MTHSRARSDFRHACFVLALIAAAWAFIAWLTGGVSLRVGPLGFSSRNPRNPALAALLLVLGTWVLSPPGARARGFAAEWAWAFGVLRQIVGAAWRGWVRVERLLVTRTPAFFAPLLAVAIAAAVAAVGVVEGVPVAGGSDSYGYVSQAHLWTTWTLRVPQPLMAELGGEIPREALAPLAYRPSPDSATIVPVTAPGLPLLMAAFELAGGRDAVFVVLPLLAALAIWATYLLGRRLNGPSTGVAAAALLATSPAFLFQLTAAPMSDIPVTAWWGLSLAMLLAPGRKAAAWAGLAAAAAVLTRPNLVPVAIVPGALLLYDALRQQSLRGIAAQRLALFAMALIPACLGIGVLYTFWYGSPLNSGYGTLEQLYSASNFLPNLTRYPVWLLESQTALTLLALAAPMLVARRAAACTLMAFGLALFACYVLYIPFDVWWYLRFLLPGYPGLLALVAAVLVVLTGRLPQALRLIALVAVVAAVAKHGVDYAAARATFASEGELKYLTTGLYVADHLPSNAVLLSEQHSGSLRYYSERVTLRFNWIPQGKLEWTLARIRSAGYEPYVVAEEWELVDFKQRFAGSAVAARLQQPPLAVLPLGDVRVYDLPH